MELSATFAHGRNGGIDGESGSGNAFLEVTFVVDADQYLNGAVTRNRDSIEGVDSP